MAGVRSLQKGFTLIEMAIVLLIIGLLAAGILVGQDLLSSAAARAQVTQIEKFQSAKNTFKLKYGALPGDINATLATRFNFAARGQYAGEGDGNGIIEGAEADAAGKDSGYAQSMGETVMFWRDLNQEGLIDGSFTTAQSASFINPGACEPGYANVSLFLPQAKISPDSVYVWGDASSDVLQSMPPADMGNNFFGIGNVQQICDGGTLYMNATSLTVAQAYNIDKKIDDGLPMSGSVQAKWLNPQCYWSGWGSFGCGSDVSMYSTPASATTCFDNNNSTSNNPPHYSMGWKNGSAQTCDLMFQFN